ncbi:hypothetical protein ABMA28_003748 [Loxostege sticticalis]|uniref:Gustatory receptor n=1 Tax=Loxostege sticticalis TaxID=481309 RepID=A0ABD0SSX4_LOXSC
MSGTFVFNKYHDVILLKKCYLLLIEQRNFINKAFGLRVTFPSILIVFYNSVMLIYLVNFCENAYKERIKIIGIVDHILSDMEVNTSIRSTLIGFRDLVKSRPIHFTASNFYRLDYTLVVKYCSVIITYTTILIQNVNFNT